MPVLIYVLLTFPVLLWACISMKGKGGPLRTDVVILFYFVPLIILCGKAGLVPYGTTLICCAALTVLSLVIEFSNIAFRQEPLPGSWAGLLVCLAILVILGFAIGSVVYSGNLGSFMDGLPTFMALIMATLVAIDKEARESFLNAASRVIPVTAFGALVLLMNAPELATISTSSLTLSYAPEGRLSGPMLHPNALGTMCAVGLVLAMTRNKGLERLSGILVCGVAILFSDQRSAQMAIILAVVVYSVYVYRRKPMFWLAASMAGVAGAIAILIGMSKIFSELFGRRTESLSVRQGIYEYLYENVNQILPFGMGPTGLYESTNRAVFEYGVAHAHNTWLSMFVIGGLVSGIAFVCISAWAIFSFLRNRAVPDVTLFVVTAVLGLVEAPVIAGSNWTIVPIALLTTLAFFPLVKASGSQRPVGIPACSDQSGARR